MKTVTCVCVLDFRERKSRNVGIFFHLPFRIHIHSQFSMTQREWNRKKRQQMEQSGCFMTKCCFFFAPPKRHRKRNTNPTKVNFEGVHVCFVAIVIIHKKRKKKFFHHSFCRTDYLKQQQ